MLTATKTKASEKSGAFFVFTFPILFAGTDCKSALSLSIYRVELIIYKSHLETIKKV